MRFTPEEVSLITIVLAEPRIITYMPKLYESIKKRLSPEAIEYINRNITTQENKE